MDDSTLLKKINEGNRSAFDIVVGRYIVQLTVYARRIINDQESARDIVQDAFIHIWEKRRDLNDIMHLRNYLYLIVRNYSINRIKSQARSSRLTTNIDLADEDLSAKYIRTETARLLLDAIENLPEPPHDVISLTLEGIKQEEIAERLQISLPTVKAHKSKGLKMLRKLLEHLS